MQTTFAHLPQELVTEIFSYLSRRDRVSCSKVCTSFSKALDSPFLWKTVVIYLDTDLVEPSTVQATRNYHEHFQSMEFCWTNPHLPTRWMQHGLQEFSKRACHYIMLLQELLVQLRAVKIVDWYEVPRFKKITYHLCKFLRSQVGLGTVGFFNVNFNKTECIKLLAACLAPGNAVRNLDICNCYYANGMFESVSFLSCMEHLTNLQVMTLDYTCFCGGVLDAILTSRNRSLRMLDITVRPYDRASVAVPDEIWKEIRDQCPQLKVAVRLVNICHYEDIHVVLRESIPLMTFSLSCGRCWDQTRSRQYRKTIALLIKNYNNTLENLYLQCSYHLEFLDDLVLALVQKCVNLQNFNFYGVIESTDLLRELCRMQVGGGEKCFNVFHVYPNTVNPDSHFILTELYQDFARKLEEYNVDFKICNTGSKNLVYLYY